MAFNRGQTDRFGRPIPASPGYQVLINADGSEVQQRNRLILPASMIVADSEDDDASVFSLDIDPVVTADDLIAAGYELPTIIDEKTVTDQAVGNYATGTWAAGKYKQLKLILRQTAVTGGSNIDEIRMVGLTGTYSSTFMYWQATAPGFVSSASKLLCFSSAAVRATFDFDIPPAPELKSYTGKANVTSQAVPQGYEYVGKNTDTTHEVTGLIFVIATDVVSFSYKLIGYP